MIHPERLEAYKDFVQPHSTNGVYDPRKGLEGLLSVLTPDPKGIVLAAMDDGVPYFTLTELQNQIFSWLERLGLQKREFPITRFSSWNYYTYNNEGEKMDGSLVRVGAVVKQAYYHTAGGDQVGYIRSDAGGQLALPAIYQAIEFVSRATEYAEAQKLQGKEVHNYDSMWRIIGAVQSATSIRRPLGVADVISFLVTNPGDHSSGYIAQALPSYSSDVLMSILSSLGDSGIITHRSEGKEVEGIRSRGYSIYFLQQPEKLEDIDKLYQQIRSKVTKGGYYPISHRSLFGVIAEHIKSNPQQGYERNGLSKQLSEGNKRVISVILSLLESEGVLGSTKSFKYGSGVKSVPHSMSSVNDLTKIFFDVVLEPIKYSSDNLTPIVQRLWDPRKVALYLQNYQKERSNIGPQGGAEVRIALLGILCLRGGEMKAGHIADSFNSETNRKIKAKSVRAHLETLVAEGLVKEPRRGYYALV